MINFHVFDLSVNWDIHNTHTHTPCGLPAEGPTWDSSGCVWERRTEDGRDLKERKRGRRAGDSRRCTCTKPPLQTTQPQSRREPPNKRTRAQGDRQDRGVRVAKEGNVSRVRRGPGQDPTPLLCCGVDWEPTPLWRSNNWRSFSVSTLCHYRTLWWTRPTWPTGNTPTYWCVCVCVVNAEQRCANGIQVSVYVCVCLREGISIVCKGSWCCPTCFVLAVFENVIWIQEKGDI